MEKPSQPTADTSAPPTPTFNFGVDKGKKKGQGGPKKNAAGKKGSGQGEPPTKVAQRASKAPVPKRYEYFSSEARESVQNALAELSHQRKKSRHQVASIKLFIEEALTLWMSSPQAKLEAKPLANGAEGRGGADPYRSFNNQIESTLKDKLSDIAHERSKVAHPVATRKAILNEAFALWLQKQDDLPADYLAAVIA